ncbi:ferredoxin [Saccharopolyspora taberi]|uniref:Ferredoxin n=1 Tax=Saccharopolyspora taberi TaxID=60895 RepID=A0ABN3VBM7_9PSEU
MKVTVDRERCEGHGLCEDVAPELFELDDEGELVMHFDDAEIPAEYRDRAARAVKVCPIAALREV